MVWPWEQFNWGVFWAIVFAGAALWLLDVLISLLLRIISEVS